MIPQPIEFKHAFFYNWHDKSDDSASMIFHTPELTDKEILCLRALKKHNCKLIIAPIEATGEEEILSIDTEMDIKSSKERLLNVMYANYKRLVELGKIDEKEKSFRQFYELRMEWHIEREKQEL